MAFIWGVFTQRLGDEYVYGGVWSPTDPGQGCDCSGLVGTVLEALTKGPADMNWGHDVSTESWPYDYNTDTPASPGTVGPYGTIAIASPNDVPADAALLITIMHGGGGEDSHTACSTGPAITPTVLPTPEGQIMESNGDAGTCTNGTGGTSIHSNIWTDFWFLPGPFTGTVPPMPPPPVSHTYAVQPGDSLYVIASRFGVTVPALESANAQITDPNLIFPGQILTIPAAA
jgi:hypothetical protein